MITVAALFVERGGPYSRLPGVECWDTPETAQLRLPWAPRDARRYAGPHPVVAHPPCARWCRLAGLVEARWGHRRGEDDGCFASALSSVRRFGGVLEHPAYSDAWRTFGLGWPPRSGGWVEADGLGWTCHVEQGRYGHPAKKATWLYAVGCDLPELRWGSVADQRSAALVSWCGNHVASGERRPRVGKAAAARTPEPFRTALLALARSVHEPATNRQTGNGLDPRDPSFSADRAGFEPATFGSGGRDGSE